MDDSAKLPYREPEIAELGDAVRFTGGNDSPVRDPGSEPPTYYNSAKRAPTEVELDD